jgi:hypothetical protein
MISLGMRVKFIVLLYLLMDRKLSQEVKIFLLEFGMWKQEIKLVRLYLVKEKVK